MPRTSEFPRLRKHTKKGKNGQSWTSWWFDMRGTGQRDIPLGSDYPKALELWAQCSKGNLPPPPKKPLRITKPRTAGKRRMLRDDRWMAVPAVLRRAYFNAERRTHEAGGRIFTLSIEEFMAIIARAGGRCELTGIPFEEPVKGTRNPFVASLDRIDSTLGYFAGNVRLVCLVANVALNSWGDAPLRVFAERLLAVR